MKQYSTNAYYNYAKRLLESDSSDSTETIKAGDSHVGKLIIGASAGAAGAVTCLKYLDDTFSISSLTTATTKLSDIAKEAATEGTGIFKRILGKLSGMVGIAISWVQKACSGILEKFPSLKKPIFNNTSAGAPTYGSVLCMALVAAAVCAVLYKIYKFIKGRRNKTESVAMYNFRKNYELSVMLDETTMFFNRLDRLIEAPLNTKDLNWLAQRAVAWDNKNPDPNFNRVAYGGSTNDALAARHAEFERQRTLAAADAERKALAQQQIKAKQNRMAGRFGVDLPQDKVDAARQAAMDKEYLKGASERFKDYHTTDPNATRMTYTNAPKQTQWTNPNPKIDINNVDTSTLSPSAAKAVQQARAATHNAAIQDIKDRTAMAKRAVKYGYSDPNLARMTTTDTQYIQLSNGKVQAITKDPSTGKLVGRIMSRTNVPKGSTIVNSPKLAKIAAQRAGIDVGEAGRLAKADIAGMNARAAKYGVSDPNLARMNPVSVSQSTVDKIHSAQDARSRAIAAQVDADDANVGTSLFRKTTTPPKAQVAKITSRTLKNGQELVTKFDKYGNEISSEVMDSAKSPAKTIGNSPAKAETFIESMKGKANTMWETSKQWCKDNPKLITIVAIIAALIACWVGVKKYKDSKAKKQASQQTAAATA